MQIQPHVQLLD